MQSLYEKISAIVGRDNVAKEEPMSRHTTFRVGGPAGIYVVPGTEQELASVISCCRDSTSRFCVIGNGSNLLVSDRGYDGVIIEIGKRMSNIRVTNASAIIAQAGASLAAVSAAARDAGLTGMEFAGGIPGTLGGACVMNAGAYDGEMKNVLKYVRLMDEGGNAIEETPEQLELGYRKSNIQSRGMIVLSAEIELKHGNREEISETMKNLASKRSEKQPLEYPSAGSTFKRPEGRYAGKLIEDCGLKGFSIGGAMVSEKHAGFVINRSGATAADIYDLTEYIITTVMERYGVKLEREIKLLGDWK